MEQSEEIFLAELKEDLASLCIVNWVQLLRPSGWQLTVFTILTVKRIFGQLKFGNSYELEPKNLNHKKEAVALIVQSYWDDIYCSETLLCNKAPKCCPITLSLPTISPPFFNKGPLIWQEGSNELQSILFHKQPGKCRPVSPSVSCPITNTCATAWTVTFSEMVCSSWKLYTIWSQVWFCAAQMYLCCSGQVKDVADF